MAKEYPYFKWFPKDAEADEKYCAMDDAELGFFHRCMNKSWMNEGLPCDPEERARVMKTPLEIANERWKRVSRSFVESDELPGRFVNPRQEIERKRARLKTEKARNSANARHHPELQAAPVPAAIDHPLRPTVTPKSTPSRTSDDQFSELSNAYDRHEKHSNWESKDTVLQVVSGMNGEFDWGKFKNNHKPYCDYWAENQWKYCTLTFLGWIRAGMPPPPPGKDAVKNSVSKPTICPRCEQKPCVCFERQLAREKSAGAI